MGQLILKQKINNFHKRVNNHKEVISVYSGIILIIVTLVLISVTLQSIDLANSLKKIQINLVKFQEKKDTNEQITLAKDIKDEIERNKDRVLIIISDLKVLKPNQYPLMLNFEKTKVELGLKTNGFGNGTINKQLSDYIRRLVSIELQVNHIKEIGDRNPLDRSKTIEKAITNSEFFLNSKGYEFDTDELLPELQGYIDERKKYLSDIDKGIEEELLLDLRK